MDANEAREILNDYLTSDIFFELPVHDMIIKREDGKSKRLNSEDYLITSSIESYSFRELLIIAYDLKENK